MCVKKSVSEGSVLHVSVGLPGGWLRGSHVTGEVLSVQWRLPSHSLCPSSASQSSSVFTRCWVCPALPEFSARGGPGVNLRTRGKCYKNPRDSEVSCGPRFHPQPWEKKNTQVGGTLPFKKEKPNVIE